MASSKVKYILIAVIIGLAAVAGWLFLPKIFQEKPYQVLAPESYATGTTLALFKNIPPDFPSNIVAENKELDYAGTLTTAEGKSQITVSYKSEKSVADLAALYKERLADKNWSVLADSVQPLAAVIEAQRSERKVTVTMGMIKEGETLVTFQYEK